MKYEAKPTAKLLFRLLQVRSFYRFPKIVFFFDLRFSDTTTVKSNCSEVMLFLFPFNSLFALVKKSGAQGSRHGSVLRYKIEKPYKYKQKSQAYSKRGERKMPGDAFDFFAFIFYFRLSCFIVIY